ncbi:MAG TPA: FixH family protein [Methylotenera sp.]|nr:FixH family protein [Methylotenera sp.]
MADTRSETQREIDQKKKAWWHYGHAWLVFGGPAAVVVACMITVVIAVKGQDPIIDQDYYRHGTEINKTIAAEKSAEDAESSNSKTLAERNALEPAMRARNHAATGVNQAQ